MCSFFSPIRIGTYLGDEHGLADLVRGEKKEGEGAVAAGYAVVEDGKGESDGEKSGGEVVEAKQGYEP